MWQSNENIIWRENDGVYVILNVSTGNYYTVNKTGSRLWEKLIVDGNGFEAAIRQICDDFEHAPDESVVTSECLKLVEEWKTEKLIMEKNPGA